MIGIALAVAILITVMSVINGFETELERRILGVSADVSVFGFDAPLADWEAMRTSALRHDDVLAAAPFVEGQGMVSSGDALLGVNVRGVHPELELEVSNLADWIGRGSMDSLMPGSWNVVIGSALAEELGVDLGDEIVLVLSKARVTPAGLSPALRSLNVSGIFDVGMSEFDRGLIVVSFQDAAALFRTAGRASGVSRAVFGRRIRRPFIRSRLDGAA
jgi:lipoprotein-releasing system permease protein